MNIFNYHPSTGVFLGISKADPDPLVEGGWLVPAYATTVATPQITSGNRAVWKGNAWALEAIPTPAPAIPAPPPATSEEKRAVAYGAESDPLFFKWQRGEGTKEAWLSKVSEIKARYP